MDIIMNMMQLISEMLVFDLLELVQEKKKIYIKKKGYDCLFLHNGLFASFVHCT